MDGNKETLQIKVDSQIQDGSGELSEMTLYTQATYKHDHGKAFLMYEETGVSGMEGTKTLLSFDGKVLQIKRFGKLDSLLRIEVGETFENNYKTEYGLFLLKTTGIAIRWEDGEKLHIEFHYQLEIEGDQGKPSEVRINIEAERN